MAQYLVGTVAELTDEDRKLVTVGGDEIVVFRHEGEMSALSNTCGHMGGPVGEGMLINRVEGVLDEPLEAGVDRTLPDPLLQKTCGTSRSQR